MNSPIHMQTADGDVWSNSPPNNYSHVIPKPVRAEEPAFFRLIMKSVPIPSASRSLRLFRYAAVLLLLAASSLAQNSPSNTASHAPSYLDPLPQDTGLPGLKQQLRKLQNTGRLMMVVAHPDDEDGATLALESRGKGVQALLLTLTRGEGGQNELGTGLFDKLGILRTLELLASDRYYGVEQRFTRVADFGYSKTPEETFQKWGGHDVPLADIVRVVREFRPDVLIARFPERAATDMAIIRHRACLPRKHSEPPPTRIAFPSRSKRAFSLGSRRNCISATFADSVRLPVLMRTTQ